MRYMVSHESIDPTRNYQPLYDALAKLGARRILNSQWILRHDSTTCKLLFDFLWPNLDSNDRLLVSEWDGAEWWGPHLMTDPNAVQGIQPR